MNKFIVSSSALLNALTPLAGVIANSPVVPILENFLFDLRTGHLWLTASDLQVSITASLPVEAPVKDTYAVCVPARLLLDTLKALPDQPVTFSIGGEKNTVQIDSANGRYKLTGEAAGDFPKPQQVRADALELPGAVLRRAIAHTAFAISTDELRPAMCGVLVERMVTSLVFVAADGHRLLRYRTTAAGAGVRIGASIIPRKAWQLLGKLVAADAPVSIAFGQGAAVVRSGGLTLTTRLIDERYPDYEKVIPVDNPNRLVMDRLELLRAVRRLSAYANAGTHQLALHLSGSQVELRAEDLDFSREAVETLACQYDGEDLTIGFNARFLSEVLSQSEGDEVVVSMSRPGRAALFTPTQQQDDEDVLMLVMPVMLTK